MSDPFQKGLLQWLDNGIDSMYICEEKKAEEACLSVFILL